jgi:uncharacterized protein YdhG (YjbR/CyaY superfamily)
MPAMPTKKSETGFSDAEKAAMKERAAESRRRAKATPEELEAEQLEKIAAMAPSDRALATRLHELVQEHAPELRAKTWYGMPAYQNAAGKTVVFFQDAAKFKYRYATLGFQDAANIDEGGFWPTSWALAEMTPEIEQRIAELLRRAVS